MNIPSCISLRQDQIDKLNNWVNSQKKMSLEEHDKIYGGACLTSPYLFQIRETSIATEIYVFNGFTGDRVNLTIDDDNKLVNY